MDTVTTSGMSPGQAESLWRYAMGEIFVPVTIDRVGERNFGGLIRSDSVGRLMVAEVQATGQHVEHTTNHIRQAADELLPGRGGRERGLSGWPGRSPS
jgi:hypothetical protein